MPRIEKKDGTYLAPSVTNPRSTRYKVNVDGENVTCTCADHETRRCKCKHIYAVQYAIQREQSVTVEANGTTTVTERVTITKTKKTYSQDWPNYNKAQQNEKREFETLLFNLCKGLQTPEQVGRGQRRLPMSDEIFCAVFKVYSTMSARRFTSDLCAAQAKGYLAKVPHFNNVLNVLENPDTFQILIDLIEQYSLPLRSIESNLAVDSTGFAFSRFTRWYDIRYNRYTSEQQRVKAHICTGVKTKIITAIEIHGRDSGDAPHLPALVDSTAKNFTMREVSADKGYTGVARTMRLRKLAQCRKSRSSTTPPARLAGSFKRCSTTSNTIRKIFSTTITGAQTLNRR